MTPFPLLSKDKHLPSCSPSSCLSQIKNSLLSHFVLHIIFPPYQYVFLWLVFGVSWLDIFHCEWACARSVSVEMRTHFVFGSYMSSRHRVINGTRVLTLPCSLSMTSAISDGIECFMNTKNITGISHLVLLIGSRQTQC